MRNKLAFIAFLAILIIEICSATSVLRRPVIEDNAKYLDLLNNSYEFSQFSDFKIKSSVFFNMTDTISGELMIESSDISRLGLIYSTPLNVYIKDNKVRLQPNWTRDDINNKINAYESMEQVIEFARLFGGTVSSIGYPTLRSGNYFLEYNPKNGEFPRYSLPSSMRNSFPLLSDFIDKVEKKGCKLSEDRITVTTNEYWNKITVTAKVEGKCKKSSKYSGGNIYEWEFPLKKDLYSMFRPTWFSWSWQIISCLIGLILLFIARKNLRPTWSAATIFLIVFTFMPWPREVYVTGIGFFSSYIFYGPLTLAQVSAIPLQIGTSYGSFTYMLGRLFSDQMIHILISFFAFLVVCYVLSKVIETKTSFWATNKRESIFSYMVLLISFIILFFLISSSFYNEKALALNLIGSLLIFSIFYFFYSLVQRISRK